MKTGTSPRSWTGPPPPSPASPATPASSRLKSPGELRRIVVDQATDTVTHLVIEPKRRHEPGRLVPVHMVGTTGGEIRASWHALARGSGWLVRHTAVQPPSMTRTWPVM